MTDSARFFHYQNAVFSSSCLSEMRDMRECGQLCDVKIKAGHTTVDAHRIVLAAAIPYFKAMFNSNMVEARKEEINMDCIDPVGLECLINFAYSGELTTHNDNVVSVLETARYLQLDCVTEACLRFLSDQLNSDNVFTIREYASSINNVDILEKANACIRKNFQSVSLSEGFLYLPLPALKDLLNRDDISVVSEEVVFESVMAWIKAEANREVHLPELLHFVRMPLLRLDYLTGRVWSDELIRASNLCRELVNKAKNCHVLREDGSTFCRSTVRSRWGIKRHHLESAALLGYGIYSVCRTINRQIIINFYDPVDKKWVPLGIRNHLVYPDYVVSTEEKIYFIQKHVVHSLHLATLKWTSMETTFESRDNAGVALHCSNVYFLGGNSKTVLSLDLLTGVSLNFSNIKTARIRPGVVAFAEEIYVIGGLNEKESSCLMSVEKYSLSTGQSTYVSKMLKRRQDFSCTVLNGKIYICGGRRSTYRGIVLLNTGEVYDPILNEWNSISNMLRPMCPSSSFSYSGKLYAVHADSRSEKNFYFETYDNCNDKWRSEESLILSGSQESFNVVFMNTTDPYRGNPYLLNDQAVEFLGVVFD